MGSHSKSKVSTAFSSHKVERQAKETQKWRQELLMRVKDKNVSFAYVKPKIQSLCHAGIYACARSAENHYTKRNIHVPYAVELLDH